MFTTLLESRAAHVKRPGSTTLSVLVHGAVIALGVAFTAIRPGNAAAPPPEEHITDYVRVAPPPRTPPLTPAPVHATSQVSAPTVPVIAVPTTIPIGIPPIDFSSPPIEEGEFIIRSGGSDVRGRPGGDPRTLTLGSVVDVALVDRSPSIIGKPVEPRYPSALRASGVDGQVLVRFVVDTTGRAEMGGVTIVEATHPLFAESVRSVLPNYRFSAGEVAGRKVRTMVQMPFTFVLR